ncbi:acyltransferase family protein [Herbaspirillum lusitanum]|uniref:Acyltransferase family protein n=1 Tax=Herbaspirillum lusitanum TaxID=213312 RepID=A0ABW9AFN9_9BURK
MDVLHIAPACFIPSQEKLPAHRSSSRSLIDRKSVAHQQWKIMNSRSKHLDVAKSICLILMIAGHTKGVDKSIYHLIYSFHMPAFFVIAGMTHTAGRTSWLDQGWRKFKRLIVPAWLFGAISGIPYAARLARGKISASDFTHRFYGTFTGKADTTSTFDSTPLWFLYALFFVYVFEICTCAILNMVRRASMIVFILVFLSIDLFGYSEYGLTQIKYTLTGILFFQVGVACKGLFDTPARRIFLAVSFVAWFVATLLSPTIGLNAGYLGSGVVNIATSFLAAVAGTYFVIQVSRRAPQRPDLGRLAQISLPIVGLNYFVEQRLNPYMSGLPLFLLEMAVLVMIAYATSRMGRLGMALHGRI